MKYNAKLKDIKSAIENLAVEDIKLKEESYNIIMVKSPIGIVKIKTLLSLQDWLKANQMKPKQQTKKKKR
jgi:hypothetical protein